MLSSSWTLEHHFSILHSSSSFLELYYLTAWRCLHAAWQTMKVILSLQCEAALKLSLLCKQLAVLLLFHVTAWCCLILDPNASEYYCAVMIESKAWVTDNFQPGSGAEEKGRTTMCIYTNKAWCITVWSGFLSCDKTMKDTEEERQRIDGGGRKTMGHTRR